MISPIGNNKRYPCLSGRQALNAKNGFTLLELLIVIFIISIVIGLSTPLFRKTFADIELNAAVQDMATLIRYAQERSAVENTVFRLNVDTYKGAYWLTKAKKEDGKGMMVFNKLDGSFGRLYTIAGDLKMEAEANMLDCYPDGEITKAKITFTNSNKKSLIIVTTPNVGSGIAIVENAQR